MAVHSIIFDIGNVLVRWDPRYLYEELIADAEELEHFLSEVVTLEWHTAHDAGLPMEEGVRQLSGKYPHYADLIDLFRARWFDTIGPTIQGSVDILSKLAERQIPLYALTNFSAETFPRFYEENSYMHHFKDILVSGEVGLIKPDPRIFKLSAQRFSIDPGTSLFIDDRKANIEAAKKTGFQTHLFESPELLAEQLKSLNVL